MADAAGVTARILIVDDDESGRLTLTALLEDEGFACVEAGSLAQGWMRLGESGSFDVVLLDHHLGDGSGLELVAEIRSVMPAARIVALSGDIAAVAGADVDAHFVKGEDPMEMVATLRRLVG